MRFTAPWAVGDGAARAGRAPSHEPLERVPEVVAPSGLVAVGEEVDDSEERWLYDSGLKYVEQLEQYAAHRDQESEG